MAAVDVNDDLFEFEETAVVGSLAGRCIDFTLQSCVTKWLSESSESIVNAWA